jgi:hypothetical protein
MSKKVPRITSVILPVPLNQISGEYSDRKEYPPRQKRGSNFHKPKRKKK